MTTDEIPDGVPFVVDHATGAKGSYCVARKAGMYHEFWNPDGWAGSGTVFETKKTADLIAAVLATGLIAGGSGDHVALSFRVVIKNNSKSYRCEASIDTGFEEYLKRHSDERATIAKDLRDFATQLEELRP